MQGLKLVEIVIFTLTLAEFRQQTLGFELEARIAALSDTVSNASEQRMTLRQELEQLQSRSKTLLQRAPIWLAAQLCSQPDRRTL